MLPNIYQIFQKNISIKIIPEVLGKCYEYADMLPYLLYFYCPHTPITSCIP